MKRNYTGIHKVVYWVIYSLMTIIVIAVIMWLIAVLLYWAFVLSAQAFAK